MKVGEVKSLVIVAPPRALGVLRQAYSHNLRAAVQAEIDKDLVRLPVHEIEKHLGVMRFPATVMPREGGASSRTAAQARGGPGSLRRLRRLLQQLADVAGQDRVAVLAERAHVLDEIAHRRALANFLRIVGGEHDA